MLEPTQILLFCILPVLLAASGFVSGSETALFSLSDHQRLEFARSGSVAGPIVIRLLSETRGLLITLMLGNMFVNVLYFVITTVLMIRAERTGIVGPASLAGLGAAVLLLLILCGEVLPKLVAARMPVPWSRLAAVPLFMAHRAISPLRLVLNALVITPLSRLIAPGEKPPDLSPQELESLLELSKKRGVLEHGEEQILQQVLELGQLKVRHLMTPRVDLKAFDLEQEPEPLLALMRQTRLSHIPVYRGDLDHIEGIVHTRAALLAEPGTHRDLEPLICPARFVPEQQRADRLLIELRKTGDRVAVVVDEYGGTAGLVTLEDVVEHMVGQIAGPYVAAALPQVQPLGSNRWRVSADLSIQDWNDAFGQPVEAHSLSTLGGLVMTHLGRLPRVGDRVRIGNILIAVERMNGRRIDTLLLHLVPRPDPTAPPVGSTPSGGAP